MTEEREPRAVWYCIDCHGPTPLDDVVMRTASGKCMCARCWQHEVTGHPIDAADLARAYALAAEPEPEPAPAEEPPAALLGYGGEAGCD